MPPHMNLDPGIKPWRNLKRTHTGSGHTTNTQTQNVLLQKTQTETDHVSAETVDPD